MLFKYNSQQCFKTDSIEAIDDYGADIGVTLKSGRTVRIHASERDRFLAEVAVLEKHNDP